MTKLKESRLQSAICGYLDVLGKCNSCGSKFYYYHVPNESGARMSVGWHSKRKREGLKAGVADIVLMLEDGIHIYVELKVDKNKIKIADGFSYLTGSQKDFRKKCQLLGNIYEIICVKTEGAGLDAMESILAKAGIFE